MSYLIVLTGWPSSGKSTAADALGSAGYEVVSMGGTLRESIEWSTEDEVWDHAEALREKHGEHGVAVPCEEPLANAYQEDDIAVLEGSRNPAEAEYLSEQLGVEIVVIWVHADIEDRVGWFAGREGRGESLENREDARRRLEERTQREAEAGMSEYLSQYDVILENDQSPANLAHKVTHVTNQLQSS